MRVIGLTGGIAAGKSTVSQALADLGAIVIDADKVGHEAYQPGTDTWHALVEHFGRRIVMSDGSEAIDRRALGGIVFAAPEEREALQAIVWPRMKEMMRARLDDLRAANSAAAVIEAAVLLEAGWDDIVDEIWVVQVPEQVALTRLMTRNNFSEDEARSRIRAQLTNDERAKRATVVIDNDGTVEAARAAVRSAFLAGADATHQPV